MAAANSYEDLIAWQEAMRLVEMIYRHTATFPREEVFGLSAQMRRSAVSVPSNIAEGVARNSSRELFQFLGIANGSLAELQTQLKIAVRLGFLDARTECSEQASRVGRILTGLRNSIRNRIM
jgi:four helix bundle protein